MRGNYNYIYWLAAIGLLCAGPAFVLGQMGTNFSYQGQLLEAGEPVTDLVTMRFSLWNAASSGSQLGSDYTASSVDVVDGLFTVQVDSANFGSSGFNGDPRWLEIEVYDAGWQTLSPRQPITPAPYALFAADSPGGGGTCLWSENGTKIYYSTNHVGIGTADPNVPLHVTTSGDPVAVLGKNTATSGSGSGVWGETGSSTGAGVFGQNINNGTGNHAGVKGVAWGSFAQGVMGYNGSTASTAMGVLGRTSRGAGVKGEATHTSSSTAYGVHGATSSTSGTGVYGYAPAGGKGVAGYSGSNDYGYLGSDNGGVYGRSTDNYGVYGYSNNGAGVRGYSATDWGVFGSSPNGSSEAGVVGAITLDNGGTLWKPNSGVSGGCQDGQGVAGRTIEGIGVFGEQTNSGNIGHLGTSTAGVYGETNDAGDYGVYGRTDGNYSTTNGVYGQATGATWGIGVRGSVSNTNGVGVYGYNGGTGYAGEFYSDSGSAARFIGHDDDCVVIDHDAGITNSAGLVIDTVGSYGEQVGLEVTVDAEFGRLATFDLNGATGYLSSAFLVTADNSGNVVEILGENTVSDEDVLRVQSDGYGSAIYGYNSRNQSDTPAVHGYHISSTSYYGVGVKGEGGYMGVEGRATGGDGTGTKYGVYGYATNGSTNYAGYFSGTLRCTGQLIKGSGTFMIDHPLDPENKYLYHSFVESPDMMNIYNGNVVTDENGEALVTMPEWFEALNMEFRYQLTVIGQFAQAIVAEKMEDNHFLVRTDKPGVEVSWQITGIRQDPFANANRVQVEVDKPKDEIGTYIHPEAWGVDPGLQVDRVNEARRLSDAEANPID